MPQLSGVDRHSTAYFRIVSIPRPLLRAYFGKSRWRILQGLVIAVIALLHSPQPGQDATAHRSITQAFQSVTVQVLDKPYATGRKVSDAFKIATPFLWETEHQVIAARHHAVGPGTVRGGINSRAAGESKSPVV